MKSILALAFLTVSAATMAQTASYSSYPAGGFEGWVVGYYDPIFQFDPYSSGVLDNIMVAIGDYEASGDQGFTLSLYDSSNGNYSVGNLLGSWHGETSGAYWTSSDVVVDTPGGITLTAGDNYWLGVVPDDNSYGTLAWDWSANVSSNMIEQGTVGYYGVQQQGAFETPASSSVPGPVALVPFCTGLIALLKRKR